MDSLSCLLPGSFDPVTRGHLDIIERVASWAGRVVVAVVHNPSKQGLFTPDERAEMLRECVAHLGNVEVVLREPALVVQLCAELGVTMLVKGVRDDNDVRFERPMADLNRRLAGVETVWVPADPQWQSVSSSLVREIASLGGDVTAFVPAPVARALQQRWG